MNSICNNYKKAVVDIDMLTTVGSADRALMIESLLEAYTYELESLRSECRKHNVKKENMDLIFVDFNERKRRIKQWQKENWISQLWNSMMQNAKQNYTQNHYHAKQKENVKNVT